jgi:peptidoglycan hydrolase-like protein with peptidoglycan-binding domain
MASAFQRSFNMVKKSKSSNGKPRGGKNVSGRELVLKVRAEIEFRFSPAAGATARAADVSPIAGILNKFEANIQPLFGLTEDRMRARVFGGEFAPPQTKEQPDDQQMDTFYSVDALDKKLDDLAEAMLKLGDLVEAAYVKPESSEPVALSEDDEPINEMVPIPGDAPTTTPDFTASQIYLNAAPAGIDARFAWTKPGGRGDGVTIIDCEWGWNFSHEDLITKQIGVVFGGNSASNDHGTAVLGEISGDVNPFGITGICPDAVCGVSSFVNSSSSARTIREAADRLQAGDIILLEIHRPGPNSTGSGQFGFIAIEWWPDDFAAIRYAVNKGIIVVEAAGNGFQNLDDAIYNTPQFGFPANWRNPFDIANPSSQAVVVGAGAPPPGTHGSNHGADRSRLGFSNYGNRVDCQGWGREVTSAGYGNLQGGQREVWYTETFSGTSSASPIVVGVLGCVQGVLKAQNAPLLTPADAINLVRTTGSPQQDTPSRPKTQRIGNRPDLREMIPAGADILADPIIIIKKGSTGAAVKKAQKCLIERFYLNVGDDDGSFGPITHLAVRNYQSDRSAGNFYAFSFPLAVDGIVGPQTWFRICPVQIKKGSMGNSAILLQELLKDFAFPPYNPGPVDGDFGPLTEGAVKAFQADFFDFDGNPLQVDGIVGTKTWAALWS